MKQKEMAVLQAPSLRALVEKVNAEGILKENIVTILKEDGTFLLIYYK